MKILHITESLAAGVGRVVEQACQGQAAAGHLVVLAHSLRDDTPDEAVLSQTYQALSHRVVVPMVTAVSPWQDFVSVLRLIKLIRDEKPEVIHLHSSKAGVLGRVAAYLSLHKSRLFYSPHGFAFLRQDVSPRKQALFLSFERIAARMGGTLLACSQSEFNLARNRVYHPAVLLLENAADLAEIKPSQGINSDPVLVLNSGRLCYQKAPWRFKQVAEQCLNLPAQFVWLGSGPLETESTSSAPDNLSITGWLSSEDVTQYLRQAGLFVMTSLWEGMPLALIEAQAAGLPAVVPNVPGCQDVVVDGVTGFICETDEILVGRVRQLVNDPDLRQKLGHNAAEIAATRFSLERFNSELSALYAGSTK